MTRARRTFERPAREHVEELGTFATTNLSDAMGRAGAMDARIQSVGVVPRVVGPALTLRVYPNDNLMCHVGVTLARPGDVLVIDAGGYTGGGLWGEMLTRAALARGVAGVVLDGAARDRGAIAELRLPVFAAAVVPRGTHKRNAGDANVPIACGGIAVEPGDIVVGDEDGVVVVPRRQAAETIARAREVVAREEAWRAALASGKPLSEIVGLDAAVADSGLRWEDDT